MKNLDKKKLVHDNIAKIDSKVSIDKRLDEIKTVKFVSNKIEEVNKLVNKFELTF